jgi:hypothetical protein
MRLLVLFLVTGAACLGAVAALNWWVDPFGEFWKPGAVRAAEQARPRCLISRDLFGSAQLPFKLGLFRSRPTRTIVLGTSRAATIGAKPGESSFTNLALLAGHLEDALWLMERMPAQPRQTIYLGVEVHWFKPTLGVHDYAPGGLARAKYLLSWDTLSASVRLLWHEPDAGYRRWRVNRVGARCVIGHGEVSDAWAADGTFVWREQLQQPPAPVPALTVDDVKATFYADYSRFTPHELDVLARLLAFARQRHWALVGFATPFPPSWVRALESTPGVGAAWAEFGRVLPRVFRRYGYPWLDLRDARSIPCGPREFIDGGFHADRACAMRIRARLDAAAARLDAAAAP